MRRTHAFDDYEYIREQQRRHYQQLEFDEVQRLERAAARLRRDLGLVEGEPPRREPPARPPPPLTYVDMSAWDSEPVPEQQWVVSNRIPRRQSVLFSGEVAAGKSTVQLHLSAAHVIARDWLGSMPEPGASLFIDAEDEPDVMHRRSALPANAFARANSRGSARS